ncbi:hypothetical protein THAOC_25413 [Thalassiosira oceanica]|uniref:Uncharacterized protein n=1 Tax=Thalassiosira oceanica TaxID=159749 RepID=K0RRA0_THAOC|nr:hypothetical protein THAOC_25413 [Thalassiosira oceanica]|eukprot:EJK54914.1 hypothetical protein THAOC_25413 [Thalassiosira oceanica]
MHDAPNLVHVTRLSRVSLSIMCVSRHAPLHQSRRQARSRRGRGSTAPKRQREEGEDDSKEEEKLPLAPSSPKEYADVAQKWYESKDGFTSESTRRPPANPSHPARRNLQVPLRLLRRHRHNDARHREPHPAPQRHPLRLHQLLQRPPVHEHHQLLVHLLPLLARQQGTASEEARLDCC